MKRYLIVTETYEVYHTDSKKVALEAAAYEMVWDTETLQYLTAHGESVPVNAIKEYPSE